MPQPVIRHIRIIIRPRVSDLFDSAATADGAHASAVLRFRRCKIDVTLAIVAPVSTSVANLQFAENWFDRVECTPMELDRDFALLRGA